MATFKGMSFPFRFNSKGGVTTSELTPEDHSRIYESIKQIIFTRKNERIMLNDFGTNAQDAVFEPTDDVTEMGILRYEIMQALEENEPRILVNDVTVTAIDEISILVTVDAHIVKFMTDATFSITIGGEANGE